MNQQNIKNNRTIGNKIGYARVSTDDQNLNLQLDALNNYNCTKIFDDTISGSKIERVGLKACLEYLRSGDSLVVWRLDRLGRTMKELLTLIEDLKQKNIAFVSLTENIDTSTASGELILHIFASLAQFERRLIVERTRAGLASARARGRIGGRPSALTKEQIEIAKKLHADTSNSIDSITDLFKVSRTTLYKALDVKGRYKINN